MRCLRLTSLTVVALGFLAGCDSGTDPTGSEALPERWWAGGETTIDDATSHAFSTPAPNLDAEALALHLEGDLAFERTFVTAPAELHGGLGPRFNDTSCVACHTRDGRDRESLLLRLSVPGAGPDEAPRPAPGFGGQLQDRAVFGVQVEGRIGRTWSTRTGQYDDGTPWELRVPHYSIEDPWTTVPADLEISPRMARPVFGLGLLEAIPEWRLHQLADPVDADGDGISGRVNMVLDHTSQTMRPGRLGWKANQPSTLQQTAGAYFGDMGITTPIFSVDDPVPGLIEIADDPEIDAEELDAATFYALTLAVPAPRSVRDPSVRMGERLFEEVGCASCHVPRHETGVLEGVPSVSNQVIHPYTDMLLHDMGEDLADGRADFGADGQEWRTPPLWGLGLTETVNGHMDLLHDGRARSIEEAILWHGGEAKNTRVRFLGQSRTERAALLAFLRSL